ncbi:hypothetical protein DAI22_06g139350 [Oryza sativa Japonica Group]|nr:hypothetical protein DAI22_06g139350 [Oryza sativa Japonica Group]
MLLALRLGASAPTGLALTSCYRGGRADPPVDVAGCLRMMTSALPLSSCLHRISDDWDSYSQRYWMCRNYSYSPEKPKPVPKGRKGKTKIPVKEPKMPPPLCDFVEWIDKEMTEFHKSMIQSWRERQEEREERQRQRAAKEKAERERREELEEKEERAEDRARKLARAQRTKDTESEAARKGKYPRCTQ